MNYQAWSRLAQASAQGTLSRILGILIGASIGLAARPLEPSLVRFFQERKFLLVAKSWGVVPCYFHLSFFLRARSPDTQSIYSHLPIWLAGAAADFLIGLSITASNGPEIAGQGEPAGFTWEQGLADAGF
jgi:hypothetical protein